MLRAGEVYEHPATGERTVVRVGTAEPGGERHVMDLYARPSAAVIGEHMHPSISESFTVLRGRVDSDSTSGRISPRSAGGSTCRQA